MSPAARALRILIFVALAIVALVAIGYGLLLSPWGRDYIRTLAERRVEAAVDAEVSIGRVGGPLLTSATIENLAITRDGQSLLTVDEVTAGYDLLDLLSGRLDLDRIVIEGPVLQREAAGALAALGGSPPDPAGGGRRFSVGEIVMRNARIEIGEEPSQLGQFRVPDVIRDLDAELSVQTGPEGTRVVVDRLSFVGEGPSITLQQLTGTVVVSEGDLILEDMHVQLAESSFDFSGTIENFRDLGTS